jgi:2-oxo-4-hydroxy-4-carboxy-5-ureidoimidazoline decarboxylase
LAAARPFDSLAGLFVRAREIARSMPDALQVELVDAHPRLGAPPASVSAMSFREQGYDQEAAADLAEEAARERDRVAAELDRLNHAYEARFGFRYCVFVAGRSRAELLPDMAAALGRERDSELHRALDAVVDIAEARSRA